MEDPEEFVCWRRAGEGCVVRARDERRGDMACSCANRFSEGGRRKLLKIYMGHSVKPLRYLWDGCNFTPGDLLKEDQIEGENIIEARPMAEQQWDRGNWGMMTKKQKSEDTLSE